MGRWLALLFTALFLALAPAAGAATVFLKIPAPNNPGNSLTGDVDTFLKEHYIDAKQADQSNVLVKTMMGTTRDLLENAKERDLKVAAHSADYYLSGMDKIEVMLDLVPLMDGFGPLANKNQGISSTAFFNINAGDRQMIVFPAWPGKILPISSEIIPVLNRGLVLVGTFTHEVISILGGKDGDYIASTTLLWSSLLEGAQTNLAQTLVGTKPLQVAKGGSLVGGAGSDLAFTVKLLLEGLQGSLLGSEKIPVLSGENAATFEVLKKELSTLSYRQKEALTKAILLTVVEELGCSSSSAVVQSGKMSAGDKLSHYVFNLCQPKDLERLLKKDSKVLDAVALHVLTDLVVDFKKGL